MITREHARNLVAQELSEYAKNPYGIVCEILDEHTMEFPWGWVFFYDSKAHVESGHFSDRVAGNAPFLVDREMGEFGPSGTAYPLEH